MKQRRSATSYIVSEVRLNRRISRRSALLFGAQAAVFAATGARLWQLQIENSSRYAKLAEENRVSFRLLAPIRGQLVDRTHKPLAISRDNYRILLMPERARNVEQTLRRLQQIVQVDESDVRRVLKSARSNPAFVPIAVREYLTWEELARAGLHSPRISGIFFELGESRYYPDAELAAHLVGYVAPPTEREQRGDPTLLVPGYQVGRAGIERTYESKLRGSPGNVRVEVNAHGRVMRELSRSSGDQGQTLQLSLDLEMQAKAQELLKPYRSGSMVMLEIETGAIRVLTSQPSFDPNQFIRGIASETWKKLVNHPDTPLHHRAITGLYSPGSTIKPLSAIGFLEAGGKADFEVDCEGSFELGNQKYHCWKEEGHGKINLVGAIRESCDVWFYQAALKTGINRLSELYHRAGLGQPTGLDLLGEHAGLVPNRDWKRAQFKEGWHAGETLITTIGQGFMLATPLQLANMVAFLARGGRPIQPWLVQPPVPKAKAANDPDETVNPASNLNDVATVLESDETPPLIDPKHIRLVLEAMTQVINHGRGTAKVSRSGDPNYTIAGKTGTAQVRRISLEEREEGVIKNEDLDWLLRDHALFVCYAPTQKPRWAVSVVVEHGSSGSGTAAPLAKKLLLAAREIEENRKKERRIGVGPGMA